MKSSTFVMILGMLVAFLQFSGLYIATIQKLNVVFGILIFLTGLYVANKKRLAMLYKKFKDEQTQEKPIKIAKEKDPIPNNSKQKNYYKSSTDTMNEIEEVEIINKG